jgi:muramoyltetrapeptide carboxypeptidase
MLMQMKLAGCFNQVAGLVLGHFADCGDEVQIHRIVRELLGGYAFPVMAGFNLGHGQPNCTLPIGMPAVLDTQRCCLQFAQPPTQG